MTLSPLDEHPVHQAPLPMREVATSDRNFYDRSYFNAFDRSGEHMLVTGLGVYPNLGVIDAYATLRHGDRQWAVHFSDALDDRPFDAAVGGYRTEVLEPLHRLRLVCDGERHGIGFDLTWHGSFPAVQEQHHVLRRGDRAILDATRFAQLGSWEGVVRVEGRELPIARDQWLGSRDRSWGIRPVGEGEPPGRPAEESGSGFYWLYMPLRFEDFAVILIVQEDFDGFRTLNDATRVWPDGRQEQLGWPRFDIRYRSGTRDPEHASVQLIDEAGKPVTLEVEPLTSLALHVGAGYGGDPDWTHGQWRGRDFSEGKVYDLTEPAVRGRIPFGVVDHAARASCDGAEGWGLFEHATVGRHDPSGFTDLGSVAP